MEGEKSFQQLFKRDDLGIKSYLDHFGVAGGAGADFFISRWTVAASIADNDLFHTNQIIENRVQAPEATATQGCDFGFICRFIAFLSIRINLVIQITQDW